METVAAQLAKLGLDAQELDMSDAPVRPFCDNAGVTGKVAAGLGDWARRLAEHGAAATRTLGKPIL